MTPKQLDKILDALLKEVSSEIMTCVQCTVMIAVHGQDRPCTRHEAELRGMTRAVLRVKESL